MSEDSSEGEELDKLAEAEERDILQKQLIAANTRIDELIALIHNMAQQMITSGYNMLGSGYDLQTLGRVISDRFPLTGAQMEIVNKSKQQPEQSVNN